MKNQGLNKALIIPWEVIRQEEYFENLLSPILSEYKFDLTTVNYWLLREKSIPEQSIIPTV